MRLKRLLLLAVLPFLCLVGQEKKEAIEKLAPYYPTPEIIVEKMLQMGGLKAGGRLGLALLSCSLTFVAMGRMGSIWHPAGTATVGPP